MSDATGAPPLTAGSARDRVVLAVVQLALLAPFLAKPVHIDDAFFLAIAEHIRLFPFDPYGFDYNWAGTPAAVWDEMKNPPAVFYGQALLLALGITGERGLHAVFALFAVAATQATYALARRVTRTPLEAGLLLAVVPAFWVSATSLMIDVPLIAAMTAALLALVVAQERDAVGWSLVSGLCAAFAVGAKYFGLAIVPLLAVQLVSYASQEARGSQREAGRALRHAGAVVLPLVAFGLWWIASDGHFMEAVGYRSEQRAAFATWLAVHGLSGATFTAGLLGFPVAMLGGVLAVPAQRGIGLIALGVGVAAGLLQAALWPGLGPGAHVLAAVLAAAFAVFVATGIGAPPRDPLVRTLWLWLCGALLFAIAINWTLNARTVLLLAPPAVLLFVRACEDRVALRRAAIGVTAGIGLCVVVADAELAGFGPAEAERVRTGLAGERVRFAGHWGFQHYMEAAGYAHIDLARPVVAPGTVVVAPVMHQVANGGIAHLAPRSRSVLERERRWPVAVMDPEAGAGLHGSFLGPLPFAFARGPLERVEVLRW